jgi:3-hydroxymyristoyl/3-hydroxydecanoyl-(acyl carrier protein) dehydratase
MAFSFVDRICALEPRRRARGQFLVPSGVAQFPVAVLVEAVGQLAAWVAMAAADFTRRPVAALAHRIALGHTLAPGTLIDLAVEIGRCDQDAILYDGTACVGETAVVRLHRCLGPMLPMADFDDPDVVRQRFERLSAGSAVQPDFGDGSEWRLPLSDEEIADEHASAVLRVPPHAAFFTDHFPRKPVLPATLLFDAQLRLAVRLARSAMAVDADAPVTARALREMKVRAFVSPGTRLALSAHVMAARRSGDIAVSVTLEGKQIASGRAEFTVDER